MSGSIALLSVVTLKGPYIWLEFSIGQYRSHLVALLSLSLVTTTMYCGASCQINRQKSMTVCFKGPVCKLVV